MPQARKYVIIIPDGAADEPVEALGGRTPLQAARLPHCDQVAAEGMIGLARNVPERFLPASDVATLSLFGYDPERYYTGRAPLEAAAMGVTLGCHDWAVRCNLMTILEGRITDFTAGHITNAEAAQLMAALASELGSPRYEFYAGVSYRNLLVIRGRPNEDPFDDSTTTTPPHDVPDRPAADHLPRGTGSQELRQLMEAGSRIVAAHPVNAQRIANGQRPANAIWLWGQGQAPALPRFIDLRGLKGAIITAVDLVRGTAALAGWTRIDAPGATGYLDTDYASKGHVAIEALRDHDLVCVHIEAPDEASHEGRPDAKVEALERIDELIVGPLLNTLRKHYPRHRLLISPDHSTLLRTRAHDRAPVPWAMSGEGISGSGLTYDEFAARSPGCPMIDQGYRLMDRFLEST
ncbi:phosphoglycerate mutase [Isosphaera pallida ATCC 43644]|uniref:Phosphoglycerate mutase n=1 Tax=Isosphaera pallida (strain ATCC 43644 / DSM 9630 / IS1B) TaxID=575540 RepID=E8R060_ISOPI|nr:cofactor-independent phosphoglycerate mutase [Isosphaera pallida]ADV61178.1 phosphoglycerate mutase [Isosphaera pallida ATCC 43644]